MLTAGVLPGLLSILWSVSWDHLRMPPWLLVISTLVLLVWGKFSFKCVLFPDMEEELYGVCSPYPKQ